MNETEYEFLALAKKHPKEKPMMRKYFEVKTGYCGTHCVRVLNSLIKQGYVERYNRGYYKLKGK